MEKTYALSTELIQNISSEQANHYRIIPLSANNGSITFKSDSCTEVLRNELKIVLDKDIELICETSENISKYLAVNFRKSNASIENFKYTEDFLEKLLISAKSIGSSDIHFEPFEHKCRIRFRLDGKLKEHFLIGLDEYPAIVNKIKIRANLDISEKRLPQDGRMTVKSHGGEFDIRVSSLPTFHGEKLVLRLLSKDAGKIELEKLGLTQNELDLYKEIIKKPNGIILISGPTGSGKTTTLYATLKILNDDKTNILTIEDPIEYTLEGINQVQLKENIGLDFSSTLKTFLRQDPDIIMVGEIRDVNTAKMAIRAALTGHLVLSTIHTNSAWATISRLIDMGIAPFLIASTLNLSVAQRLLRLLCTNCKYKSKVDAKLFPNGFLPPNNFKYHFKAVGCVHCHFTGYSGRKAIYEILPIDKDLVELIKRNELEIDDYLKFKKIVSLEQNATELLIDGLTSLEEVYPLLIGSQN